MIFWHENQIFLLASRFIAGSSFGFLYIALITQIGDNVRKSIRGYITTVISISTTFAMMLATYFGENLREEYSNFDIIFGVVMIGLIILAIVLTLMRTQEPVTHLLKSGHESEATQVLKLLYDGSVDDFIILSEVNERKFMITEDYKNNNENGSACAIFDHGNGEPMLWLTLLRFLAAITTNPFIMALSAKSVLESEVYLMQIIIYLVKFIVVNVPRYSIDILGRKPFLLISGIACTICFIPFTLANLHLINIRSDLLAIITISMHIFIAIGIDPVQHIYLVEAFPLSKRNASLAFVTTIEYIMQALLLSLWMSTQFIDSYYYMISLLAAPFLVLILSILLFVQLPETKFMSLRKCRDAFRKKIPIQPRVLGIQTIGNAYRSA